MYFAIIIPILLVTYLLIFHRKKIVWWEIILPFVVTIITISICQFVAYKSAISDVEYLGHMVVKAVHEEPMAYDSTCTETYACGTDSEGNTTWCTRSYPCVRDASRETYFVLDNGDSIGIDLETYNKYESLWKKYHYKKGVRVIEGEHGDKYNRPGYGSVHECEWNGKIENSVPVSERTHYDNFIQASKSLYNPRDISERELQNYKLFDYPKGNGENPIIAADDKMVYPMALKRLQYANGWLNTTMGGMKKVRLWVLMYRNQPAEIAEMQKVYWKNGNKNEFIIMLNVDDNYNLTWFDIMTWSEKEDTKILVRNYIAPLRGKRLDNQTMTNFAVFLQDTIQKSYLKPSFKKYSYLNIPPSMTAIVISWIIVLLVCVGTGFFVILNDIDNEDNNKPSIPNRPNIRPGRYMRY